MLFSAKYAENIHNLIAFTHYGWVRKVIPYLEALGNTPLNERQRKIIGLLLDGFEGKLTTSKWAKIAKCSQDSAYRDILDLVKKGILIKNDEGGRSTSYGLK